MTYETLKPSLHGSFKFKKLKDDFSFAQQTAFTELSIHDWIPCAQFMPLVFSSDTMPRLIGLMGAQAGHNNFVDARGQWLAPAIPSKLTTYPFEWRLIPGRVENNVEILVDSDAPHFNQDAGKPLFKKDGKPSKALQDILNIIQKEASDYSVAQAFVTQLKTYDVLIAKELTMQKEGESVVLLNGFQVVDIEKLKSLDTDVIQLWEKNGMMALIKAHVDSLQHFEGLLKQLN